MGGSQSHEFMVASDAGEDYVVSCPACGYAANLEKAAARATAPARSRSGRRSGARAVPYAGPKNDRASSPLSPKLPESSQMKSLVMVADGKPVLALVRGDHSIERNQIQRRGEGRRNSAGASGGNPATVRRRRRLARAGGRQEHARDRRRGSERPPQHDRRLESRTIIICGTLRRVKISKRNISICGKWLLETCVRRAAAQWR